MKKIYLYGGIVVVIILVTGFMFIGQSNSSKAIPKIVKVAIAPVPSPVTTPQANTVTVTSTTNSPEDIVPGLYPNPIKNTATASGIKISSVQVENNTDVAGHAVSDHLQFTIENMTKQKLSNVEVYYTIIDTLTNKKEGYYKALTGFTLSPNGKGTVHFDGQSGYGHYTVNTHGVYGTATDQLKFTVEVSVPGYAPVYVNVTKAPGGAEVVGQ